MSDPRPPLHMTLWRPARPPIEERPTMALPEFAGRAGLHPELVRRFVVLGLLDAGRQGAELRFAPDQLVAVGRIQRLRAGLSLNYAAIGLVLDLLDRIDRLESALSAGQTAQTAARSRAGAAGPVTVVHRRSVRSWI